MFPFDFYAVEWNDFGVPWSIKINYIIINILTIKQLLALPPPSSPKTNNKVAYYLAIYSTVK